MNAANRAFYGLLSLAGLVAVGLAVASARLLVPLTAEVLPIPGAIARWCLQLFTGSPGTDELVVLGLLGLLPIASLLGLASLGQQWWDTRRLVRAQIRARLDRWPECLERMSHHLDLGGRIDVVRSGQTYSFCYGLIRPRVCVSTGLMDLLSETELEAVLLHERCHLRSRDPLKVLLVRMLDRAFFFLPLIGELGRHYLVTKELEADRAVLSVQGDGRPLAAVLYKLMVCSSDVGRGAAVANLGDTTAARIDHLLDGRAASWPRPSFAAVVITALVLGAIAMIVVAPGLLGAGLHPHVVGEGSATICPL